MARRHDDHASGDGNGDGLERFGLAIGQPVEAGDTDEYTEALAERQIVGRSHQRRSVGRTGIVARAGCLTGSRPNR